MLLNAAMLIVPIALGAALLYWIVRFGVKHGLRSYYAEGRQETGSGTGLGQSRTQA